MMEVMVPASCDCFVLYGCSGSRSSSIVVIATVVIVYARVTIVVVVVRKKACQLKKSRIMVSK